MGPWLARAVDHRTTWPPDLPSSYPHTYLTFPYLIITMNIFPQQTTVTIIANNAPVCFDYVTIGVNFSNMICFYSLYRRPISKTSHLREAGAFCILSDHMLGESFNISIFNKCVYYLELREIPKKYAKYNYQKYEYLHNTWCDMNSDGHWHISICSQSN